MSLFAGVAGAVAAQREWDRRRKESILEDQGIEQSQISGVKSLAMGTGVAVGSWLIGAFEGSIATKVARAAAWVLPGGEECGGPSVTSHRSACWLRGRGQERNGFSA